MKYNLPDRILREIVSFAKEHSITKIILFGSRARGTNTERSDIDIAVYGGILMVLLGCKGKNTFSADVRYCTGRCINFR